MLGTYVGNIINLIQGILLVPLFIKYIGVGDYGYWLASGGILGMMLVINFGFSNVFIQGIANSFGKGDYEGVSRYFSNGIIVYFLISLIFIFIGITIANFLDNFIKVEDIDKFYFCFILAVFSAGFSILNECLRGFAQSILRPILSIFYTIIFRIIGIIVTVYFLLNDAGLWSIAIGMLISEIFIFLCGLIQSYYFFKKLALKFTCDFNSIIEYFRKSSTIAFATIGSSISRESDPIIITYLLGAEINVIYMVTRKISDFISQSLSAVYGSTYSSFSHLVGEGNLNRIKLILFKITGIVIFLGLIGFSLFVILNKSFMSLWIGSNYYLNTFVLIALGFSCLLINFKNLFAQLLNSFGLFKYSALIVFFDGLLKVIFSYLFIKIFGIFGVPFAASCIGIISSILLISRLLKRLSISINYWLFLKISLFITFVFLFSGFISNMIYVTDWLDFFIFASLTLFILTITLSLIFINFLDIRITEWKKLFFEN